MLFHRPLHCLLHHLLAPCSLFAASALALAQTPPPPQPPAAPASAASAASPASAPSTRKAPTPSAAASAPADAGPKVEIIGTRLSDTEERRRSTAAKIVIGREEIAKFGDATLGEVLRRLPGVTTPGAPGRGGPPRLRGLGAGFTQLLIDGQRMPPGFSLESLPPEMVERIEILRAPTAETGARAIAGTINIITRDGFKLRLNDLRLGFGYENGQLSPGFSWTRNETVDALTYNITASAFRGRRESSNTTQTTVQELETGTLLEDRTGRSQTHEQRQGLNLVTRLTWRLNENGDLLLLTPSVFHAENHSDIAFDLKQALSRPGTPSYDTGASAVDGQFTNARLGGQWRQRLGGLRAEANGHVGAWRSRSDVLRNEYNTGVTAPARTLEDHYSTNEHSYNLTLKASGFSGGQSGGQGGGQGSGQGGEPGTEHSLVGGAEIEGVARDEVRISVPDLADFGDNLSAASLRLAGYLQDEWAISPNWAAHAGLRWEGITTQGDTASSTDPARPTNRSSVWTPLLHAVWKPDPKSRDQIRISLTRSYRSPALGALIARPTISRDYPVNAPNTPLSPDTAGNPYLNPELATGLDLAAERYLDGGGVLSANLFHRSLSNVIRGVTTLETVSWSTVPRYVRRQRNIGDASTSGLEMDAKFRLDQLVSGAPGVELRANLSLYRSRVEGVPGPDNRLEQQADATANLGADYRLRGLPLSLGGNLNWVPGYTTRLDADRAVSISTKRVWDGYALWTFNPGVALRLLGNNLAPRDYTTTNVSDVAVAASNTTERNTARSTGPSYINWQLRLELKL